MISIGRELRSEAVTWVGSIMTIGIVALYLCVLVMHGRAVVAKRILWEGKNEDVYVQEKKGKLEGRGSMDIEGAEKEN